MAMTRGVSGCSSFGSLRKALLGRGGGCWSAIFPLALMRTRLVERFPPRGHGVLVGVTVDIVDIVDPKRWRWRCSACLGTGVFATEVVSFQRPV